MSKVSNVLTMLELLQSGKKYSINELSSILEVSERMIRVYKEDLENRLEEIKDFCNLIKEQ